MNDAKTLLREVPVEDLALETQQVCIHELFKFFWEICIAPVIPSSDIILRSIVLLPKLTHLATLFFLLLSDSSALSNSFTLRAFDMALDSANLEISDDSWTKVPVPPMGLPTELIAVTDERTHCLRRWLENLRASGSFFLKIKSAFSTFPC